MCCTTDELYIRIGLLEHKKEYKNAIVILIKAALLDTTAKYIHDVHCFIIVAFECKRRLFQENQPARAETA